ncbi:MAG: hypothetical protein WD883_02855 [Candidatus Colwellbacteria bacterium]
MSKKIYLNKSDSVASAIDKVLKAEDEEVILYIPRDAEAASTKKDLELLQREVAAAGKTLKVETVDEGILERVSSLGIEATNPFLGRRGRTTVSDIVVQGSGRSRARASAPRGAKSGKKDEQANPVVNYSEENEGEIKIKHHKERSQMSRGKLLGIKLGSGALVIALIFMGVVFLPRVSVSLELDKMEHGFIGAIRVSPSIEESAIVDSTIRLRGVSFTSQKNITNKYQANGMDSVGRRARGTITIYNDFNSESQPLVATTRFVTPDGKIYRLDTDVTVPGATTNGSGELVPSSVDAAVTADQPGEEYNIGPVSKFRIPGFQGSARYDGFYGESKSAMTGGAFGEVKVPTEADLEAARADAAKKLEDALKADFFVGLPDNIKVLEGAYSFGVVREQVNDVVDKDGNFNLTTYGEIQLIGFDESELVDVLRVRFEETGGVDLQIHEYTAEYAEVSVDFEVEELNSAVNFKSTWIRPFNVETFRGEIVGMTENQLREKLFSTPGVRSGGVKMWPFWVNKVPQKINRVSVDAR